MKPLVSILIPAYNAQAWIAETLRSAVAQTWERREIIVVDDGSTDETAAVARQSESDGVVVVSQRNQGAAAARNTAFAASRGDYIQWLDADDLLAPDKIEHQLRALESCRLERPLLSGAWGSFFFRPHRARFTPTALWCDHSPADWLATKMSQNLHMQTATWLVSREITQTAGPWDTTLLGDDDGEYFCRILLASDGVRFVPEAKVYYRATGSTSLSYIGSSARKVNAHWRSMELHIGYLRSLEDSERTRAACVRYLQTWIDIFHPERPDIVGQAQAMAQSLGGRLEFPSISWKYAWIRALVGLDRAKLARVHLRNLKWSLVRSWDRTLYRIEAQLGGAGQSAKA